MLRRMHIVSIIDFDFYGSFCPSYFFFEGTFNLRFSVFPNKVRHKLSHADKYLCNGENVASAPRSSRVSR